MRNKKLYAEYGYVDIDGTKINVLIRRKKTSITMLSDEEEHLNREPKKLNDLLRGNTVKM